MNRLDYFVLIATILAIPLYGLWRTRGSASLGQYLKGDASIRWATIGLSVLATQAGPITFLSMPGQAYESGIGFIQNYFGQPLALIVVCAVFVPIYQRLKVYTAYQYLGERFDRKTQLLGAFLFLVQRGIAAGITIYAPAIVLSTLLGWRLNLTIWFAGGLVIIYTVMGGTKIVSITQRYQMIVILVGMAIAFAVAVYRLSPHLSFENTLLVAGKMGKLEAVDFSVDPHKRYTFWSGLIGGFFLALSYFGADQSQVQRYLAGGSLKESRLGLLFNAAVKVPMQFFILLLGAIVFMFYQFEKPPVYFNQPAYQRAAENGYGPQLTGLQTRFDDVFMQKRAVIRAISSTSSNERDLAMTKLRELDVQARELRDRTKAVLEQAGVDPKNKDSDYVFITFILQQMPHGLVGLLIAVILCATMSATAATLNALGSTTAIDFYRPLIRPNASDHHYVVAAKALTAAWGLIAIGVASFASLVENLIEAGNILGSVFYGSILGLFLAAFFIRRVTGSAVFFAAVLAQSLVFVLFATTNIGYLWYNFIGCAAVLVLATLLQQTIFRGTEAHAAA
ncbi:MAG: sodium:solute symporter [Verrucomicrobia bacterium]|nr:MAG: sodium:solute symporter [Verrucomicrobia bacterium 13_2_20CM_55_10]PYI43446.1 MAG: sodium:solute symporter [Verrucomicrobiota bacterium]PYI64480.1 MAG: sodium:solute symporter [Verrucomicrobiota bacterium]